MAKYSPQRRASHRPMLSISEMTDIALTPAASRVSLVWLMCSTRRTSPMMPLVSTLKPSWRAAERRIGSSRLNASVMVSLEWENRQMP